MYKNTIATIIFVMVFSGILLKPPAAHAIIFLPALILIPIAQLIAYILGFFTLPVVITSFIWSKLFKKSWKRGLLYSVIFLISLAVLAAIVLKLITPDRPLF